VQAIAEAHHGSARVHSTPGHGSAFELLLPPPGPASAPAARAESRPPRAGQSFPQDAKPVGFQKSAYCCDLGRRARHGRGA
jgi:hypothetical protein